MSRSSLTRMGTFNEPLLVDKETTVVPATEASAGRTGKKPPPHPSATRSSIVRATTRRLEVQRRSFFEEYHSTTSPMGKTRSDAKVSAVLSYVEKEIVVADSGRRRVLYCGPGPHTAHRMDIGSYCASDFQDAYGPERGNAIKGTPLCRWRVQVPGDPMSALWDRSRQVRDSWIRFDADAGD